MNRATLLAGVFLVASGLTYAVWAPGASVPTCADLIDGGVADPSCSVQALAVSVRVSDDARAKLIDAGVAFARPGQRYVRLGTIAMMWDGGMLPPLLNAFGVTKLGDPHVQVVDHAGAVLKPCDARCALSPPVWLEPSPCSYTFLDGGTAQTECGVLFGDEPEATL